MMSLIHSYPNLFLFSTKNSPRFLVTASPKMSTLHTIHLWLEESGIVSKMAATEAVRGENRFKGGRRGNGKRKEKIGNTS